MATPLTIEHLDGLRAEMTQNTKDILADQRERLRPVTAELQGIHEQLQGVHTKLDAIMSGEVLVTRAQVQRLLGKLKAQGFKIDEQEIFA